jgi:hypothetical protein
MIRRLVSGGGGIYDFGLFGLLLDQPELGACATQVFELGWKNEYRFRTLSPKSPRGSALKSICALSLVWQTSRLQQNAVEKVECRRNAIRAEKFCAIQWSGWLTA